MLFLESNIAYLSAKLSRNDDFATLGSGLHDEPEHTVASTTNGQATDELVPKGLGLCNSAKTTSGHLLGVQFDGVLREAEPLLHDGGQFTDPPTLFTQDVLGAGGHDDDFGLGGSHTDLDTGVTIFSQLTSQELVQFGLEHAIGDKLELENKSEIDFSKRCQFFEFSQKIGLENLYQKLEKRLKMNFPVCSRISLSQNISNSRVFLPSSFSK